MMDRIGRYLAVGAAGSIGAVLRVVINECFGNLNLRFPSSTLFINVTGSLFLGWFLTHIAGRDVSQTTRVAIAAGFVGAYTTFSTFMYDTNQLASQGEEWKAMVNLVGSIVLGILAVRMGIYLARFV